MSCRFSCVYNDKVILSNYDVEGLELLKINESIVLRPLSKVLVKGKSYEDVVIDFFKSVDDDFINYLGIGDCSDEESAIKSIQRLLDEERDGGHKYWLIYEDGVIVGIFYIYGLRLEWSRVNVAIGFGRENKGKRMIGKILRPVCVELFKQGLVRVGAEVETSNSASLFAMERVCNDLGFRGEGCLRSLYGEGIDCIVFSVTKGELIE